MYTRFLTTSSFSHKAQARSISWLASKNKTVPNDPISENNSNLNPKRPSYRVDITQSNLLPGEILVGQPDPVSNLRKFKFFIPKDETKPESFYRKMREEAQEYNQTFWKKNNERFSKGLSELEAKGKYIILNSTFIPIYSLNISCTLLKKNNPIYHSILPEAALENRSPTEEEISNYYRKYLNDSYIRHSDYNIGWWKRNLKMLIPGILSSSISLSRLKKRKDSSMIDFADIEFVSKNDHPPHPHSSATSMASRNGFKNDNSKLSTAIKPSSTNPNSPDIDRRKEKIDSYY
ncbi:Apoptogenic protein 1, mitochondrial [Smittium mucronatum]|uniref:Apoptogenic protein 1, mitochondrial n=1 Tax=Smittium mucronatum TaxID=133383 RepID=A0A1R0GRT7_9FUNG|nr:Apoptogenic protein 1, mitochondrial [Smittium mucronatum]